MDIKDLLIIAPRIEDSHVSLTGWIVDTEDGLFLLGAHLPEDYNFQQRVKIINFNIMHCILKSTPKLVGGFSNLFYRCRAFAKFINLNSGLIIERLAIESVRNSAVFHDIDVSEEAVASFVKRVGHYNFARGHRTQDWLDEV